MKLLIDNKLVDIEEKTDVIINLSDKELQVDAMSDVVEEIEVVLPMTQNNVKIFGYAYDPNEEFLFNNQEHNAIVKKNDAVIFAGTIILVAASHKSDNKISKGYFKCRLRKVNRWLERVKASMFNKIPVGFRKRLSAETIKNSWYGEETVRLLPVRRDVFFEKNPPDYKMYSDEYICPAHYYHPFLNVKDLVTKIIEQEEYSVDSQFMNQRLFKTLHMSGNYPFNEEVTVRLKDAIDFRAGRLTDATAYADELGKVYADPLITQNSIGKIVETATTVTYPDGSMSEVLFNHNNTFQIYNGSPVFAPGAQVLFAFEYDLIFITEYEMQSRDFLCGFDTITMEDGLIFDYKLPNRFVDYKKDVFQNSKYWIKIFEEDNQPLKVYAISLINEDADLENLTPQDTQTKYIATITKNGENFITPSKGGNVLEVILKTVSGQVYDGDWAMYLPFYPNTGEIEVRVILRTNFDRMAGSYKKYMTDITFQGAKPGMKFQIRRLTNVRPILLPHPGLGEIVEFKDVAAHQIRQIKFVEALNDMFNLRFYTDYVNKKVRIETRDTFYSQDIIDWCDKVDLAKPITVAEMGRKLPRKITKQFRTGDGAVTRYNMDHGSDYGSWMGMFNKYTYSKDEESIYNPLFTASISSTLIIPYARNAKLISAGDRGRRSAHLDEELNFEPKIVSYLGMKPLGGDDKWGYPSYGTKYPYVTFFDIYEDISLRYNNVGETKGLIQFFEKEYRTEENSREITLNVWLTPQDIESFVDSMREGPCFRSLFVIRLGNEKLKLRIKEIKNYNPNSGESTTCVFFKELD